MAKAELTPIAERSVSEIEWSNWSAVHRATLLFVIQGDDILLIRKKTGLGEGKINGPGGKVDPGETAEACAIRECQEELHITPIGPELCGRHLFQFIDGYSIDVSVFKTDRYEGTPTETVEAEPIWFKLKDIPYQEMWADDELWLPLLLANEPFVGWYVFDDDAMLDHRLISGEAAQSHWA